MYDVFISHSESDKAFVQRLSKDLRACGLEVWADESLAAGERWVERIESAISDSANVLIVLSKRSQESGWQRTETALALSDETKRVIPLYADRNVEAPLLLRSINGVDFSDPGQYSNSLEHLLKSLIQAPASTTRIAPDAGPHSRLADLQRYSIAHEVAHLQLARREQTRRLTALVTAATAIAVLTVLITLFAWGGRSQTGGFLFALIGFLVGVAGSVLGYLLSRQIGRKGRGDGAARK